MFRIKKEFLIYLAAFFDCEGSLQVRLKKLKNGKYRSSHVRISISNNNKKILDEFVRFLGYGHVVERKRKKLSKSGRPFKIKPCNLIIVGVKALNLLKMLYPYLRIKKDHAKLCILYPVVRKGGRPTEGEELKRIKIRRELHILNKRDNEREIKSWVDI